MNEVVINYRYDKKQKMLSLIVGIYITLYGGYHSILLAIDSMYDVNFYLGILAVIAGLILVLNVTLFAPKPVFVMNQDMIYSNVGVKTSVFKTNWKNIKNVAIGLSYIRIIEIGDKEYNVDLSGLKYADLKDIKSRVIEYCEAKMISYQND